MRPLARDSSLADVAFQLTVALFSSRPNSLDPCFDSRINHRSKRPMAQLPSQTMVQPSWTSLRSSTLLPRWYDCACVCTVWCEEMLVVGHHEVFFLCPPPPPARQQTNAQTGGLDPPSKQNTATTKRTFSSSPLFVSFHWLVFLLSALLASPARAAVQGTGC